MGIQIMVATLAVVGVLTGSAIGGKASAASDNKIQEPPKMECVYAGDCVQAQMRTQDRLYTGNQIQDRDQLRIQDCVVSCDCTQDQLRTQDQLQSCDGTQEQLRTQDPIRAGK
jgi:hypothetical protein